jgi:sulfite exporter TauE/SafE
MPSDSIKLVIAGFVMGWGPCLTYTAPLLLPYIGATTTTWQDGLKVGVVFSIGRLLALAILGGLVTMVFSRINQFFPPQRSGWVYGIVSLFMIVMGICIILGKGFKIPIGNNMLKRGTESMFLFGFLMGVAPCVPYVAILTYIACIAENDVLAGMQHATVFALGTAIAPIVLGAFMGLVPGKVLKSMKLLKTFQAVCGIVLIFFGFHLLYYVVHALM